MHLEPQRHLLRQSATSDSWGRYYTATSVSSALVGAVNVVRPNVIVELGAGYGSIASAAARKWKDARFVTVDSDHLATPNMDVLGQGWAHTHHVHDALDDALAERIGLSLGSVDIGLCNPPYVRPRWKASFGRILEDAGLSGALKSVHDAGADLLFIAQNLRLLKQRGKLGLVLPDGLITGEKYQGVRSVLLREHLIEQVIQLPRRVFSRTEAQTYLVVLSKRVGETQAVTLQAMDGDGDLSEPIHVAADEARRRLDYSFHALRSSDALRARANPKRSLAEVSAGLIRGTLSSHQLESLALPVFHLGDFPVARLNKAPPRVPASFIRPKAAFSDLPNTIAIAKRNDILIARIGRNLHEKICVVKGEACIISDCVYALRVVSSHHDAVLAYLTSRSGRQALQAVAHGVGAKHLTRSDLLALELPF